MKKVICLLVNSLFAGSVLLSPVSHAVLIDHVYDVNFDGTSHTESYAGDLNLEQGGSVQLNFITAENDYWNNMTDTNFWSPLYITNGGARTGDYIWSYYLDGALVASGSALNNLSSSIHFINHVDVFSGMFDQLTIDYMLTTSTTGDTNTLSNDPSKFWSPVPFNASYVDHAAVPELLSASNVVPEPATLALMGLGLAGIGFSRKRKVA